MQIYELQMRKIRLINENAKMLNFGTRFDYGGKEASLNYFEKLSKERSLTTEEKEAQFNRRLLYNSMIVAGFEPYGDEWWHFNSRKTQMGAKTAGFKHAEYGAITLSEKNLIHEKMRVDHRIGTLKIYQGIGYQNPSVNTALFEAATKGASESGDLRLVVLPEVEMIEPK